VHHLGVIFPAMLRPIVCVGQQFWSNATVSVGALEIGATGGSLPPAQRWSTRQFTGHADLMGSTVDVQGPLFVGTGIGATGPCG